MAVFNLINKIATFMVLALFLLGVWDAMQSTQSEIPIYQSAVDSVTRGDMGYLVSLLKMSWGWSTITPAVKISTLPWYLGWYGWYNGLFFPEGYMPLFGFEHFLLIGLILLGMLPLAIILKKKKMKNGIALGLPLWFFLLIPLMILIFYPIWNWVHFHWLFIPGAEVVFGIDEPSAHQIWVSFAEKTESFSWFFVIMTVLGIYKGGTWGKKFKKW